MLSVRCWLDEYTMRKSRVSTFIIRLKQKEKNHKIYYVGFTIHVSMILNRFRSIFIIQLTFFFYKLKNLAICHTEIRQDRRYEVVLHYRIIPMAEEGLVQVLFVHFFMCASQSYPSITQAVSSVTVAFSFFGANTFSLVHT